jgi:lycopene cyclase domain-containing protein
VKLEYLLLDFAVLFGPLVMSFEKQIRFVTRWRMAFPAIFIVAPPFWIWDALVTGRHWQFNDNYTLPARLFSLPLEEYLFFIAVPFAALFIWEVINFHIKPCQSRWLPYAGRVLSLSPVCGLVFFLSGREYSGLMLIALGAAALLDLILRTRLFAQLNLLYYLAAVTIFTLIFNGYLTARPVVLYDEQYQVGVRLGTIPLEDFGYGFALVLLVTTIYEKFKARAHG